MTLETTFDHWHTAAREQRWLYKFAWVTRILLALAFLPSSLTKILGHRFTNLGLDSPVGFFFEAMYRTGIYWNFIGVMQLTAAILLIVPRMQALGALLYFPIVLNIFLITVGIGFQGTPFITGAMLLGSFFLLCWHYDAWKSVLFPHKLR
ncbi:MAG TPA: hypothetical protein VJZ00_15150 [Thermoanaerobaculia bacterium]|nr:hypothetical protein [Thermoanaerobaculia bacterium]